ncbi:hypothetical protein BJ741DRAFT_649701 [Chytriomyces cf. hyalinus JEL632]|nr:hypothetical protein BJ741DRAFT_649701 [Chytriomyces cf. hyalinus JEL632]
MDKRSANEAKIDRTVEQLTNKLRRRLVTGSFACAVETAKLLSLVIRMPSHWTTAKELQTLVKDKGRTLIEAQPIELAVGSIVNKVVSLIGEESELITIQNESSNEEMDLLVQRDLLRNNVVQSMKEMLDDIQTASQSIANGALEHIHSDEIFMTLGRSPAVEGFLKEAAKLRKFKVMVAETSPSYGGQELALSLSKAGIDTTVITDASVFAVMSRVNKVILGTHAVLANGGLVAISGSQVMAAAAKHYSTPVVVLAELYKMSAVYPFDVDAFNLGANPDAVFGFEDGYMIDHIDAINPTYDFVVPDLISLFITNEGAYPPSYVSRLIYEDTQNI